MKIIFARFDETARIAGSEAQSVSTIAEIGVKYTLQEDTHGRGIVVIAKEGGRKTLVPWENIRQVDFEDDEPKPQAAKPR